MFQPEDRLHLKGLNYMNDDPSEVHVLYLQVGKNGLEEKILKLVDHISQTFFRAGLATGNDIEHNEKLHATLMNSKWRAVPEPPPTEEGAARAPPPKVERMPFDIRPIMEEYEDVDLGLFPLATVEMSRMGAKTSAGYWVSDQTVAFPGHEAGEDRQ